VFAATILIYLDPKRQPQIRFQYPVLGVKGSAICEKNHSVAVEPKSQGVLTVSAEVGLVASSFRIHIRAFSNKQFGDFLVTAISRPD
jgi:hypothetical protein|tara:strand:- start:244 stop:504 length:261 start_codon:yes stop_codon:yes gene_type:complete